MHSSPLSEPAGKHPDLGCGGIIPKAMPSRGKEVFQQRRIYMANLNTVSQNDPRSLLEAAILIWQPLSCSSIIVGTREMAGRLQCLKGKVGT